MVLIFALSHMPGKASSEGSRWIVDLLVWIGIDPTVVPLNTLSFLVRKTAHFTEYLLLAVLSYPILRYHVPMGTQRSYLLAWAFCVLYAISDEWHQSLIPGREAAALDVGIDAVGAAVGLWLTGRVSRRQP